MTRRRVWGLWAAIVVAALGLLFAAGLFGVAPRSAYAAVLLQVSPPVVDGTPPVELPKLPSVPTVPKLPVPAPAVPPSPQPQPHPSPQIPSPAGDPRVPPLGPTVPGDPDGLPFSPGGQGSAPTDTPPTPAAERPTPETAQQRRKRKYGTGVEGRRNLVAALDGCLAALPDTQRHALIMRFGVGSYRPISLVAVARLLGVSPRSYRRIETLGVRALLKAAHTSGCEDGAVAESSFASFDRLLVGSIANGRLASAIRAGMRPRSPASSSDADRNAVRSAEASSGPELATPFGNLGVSARNPMFAVLLALMLAATAWVGRSFLRAVR